MELEEEGRTRTHLWVEPRELFLLHPAFFYLCPILLAESSPASKIHSRGFALIRVNNAEGIKGGRWVEKKSFK